MDKYNMFKNFLFNELEITKEDIRDWTKEAVYEVAENFVKNQFSEYSLKQYMNNLINKTKRIVEWTDIGWKDELGKFVTKTIEEHLENTIKGVAQDILKEDKE